VAAANAASVFILIVSSAAVVLHRRNGSVNPSVRRSIAVVYLEFIRAR
jgi:hypothetical protein